MHTTTIKPDFRGIKEKLIAREIEVKKVDKISAEFEAPRGVYLEDIYIQELDAIVKVIRFSKKEGDYLIPAYYNLKAELGDIGFQILLFPICWLKLRRETLKGPPDFFY